MTAAPCADARRSRRGRGRGRAGFTLVELLVAMVVLSLVAVTMAAGLRFVIRAFEHTDSRRAALEELTLGFSVLRGEIERAEPLMRRVNNDDRVLFEGGADRVRFVNVEPPYLAGRPYLVFEYAIAGDPGNYRIELRRAALDPAEPDLDAAVADAEPRVVLRVPQLLEFSYFGQARKDERPRWYPEWTRRAQLPAAVRLAAGTDPGWPDLVVPLEIRAPWYCGGAGGQATGGGGGGGGGRAGEGATTGIAAGGASGGVTGGLTGRSTADGGAGRGSAAATKAGCEPPA